MAGFFRGYYLKHQKDGNILAFIPGQSDEGKFVQVITNKASYNIPYIRDCCFLRSGVIVHLSHEGLTVDGEIKYGPFNPIKYDIMGPFKYLPMECRHGIISMSHSLDGAMCVNGEDIDLKGGTGYIEMDSGRSFPRSYTWLQCCGLVDNSSVMVSVAHIPMLGTSFEGCICVIKHDDKEYRLATYLGVRIIECAKDLILLEQGRLLFRADIKSSDGHKLYAPHSGRMTRTIHESPSCPARFRLFRDGKILFDMKSDYCGYENVTCDCE